MRCCQAVRDWLALGEYQDFGYRGVAAWTNNRRLIQSSR